MPSILGSQCLHVNLAEVIASKGPPPWSEKLVANDHMWAVLICQAPGQGNQRHYHPESDEWWIVLQGELIWDFGEHGRIHARAGDAVFAPKGMRHQITVVGDGPAVRLAMGIPDVPHLPA